MVTSTTTIIAIPLLAMVARQAVSSTLLLSSLGVLAGSAMMHIETVAEWTPRWGGNVFGFAWGDIFLAISILLTAWRVGLWQLPSPYCKRHSQAEDRTFKMVARKL